MRLRARLVAAMLGVGLLTACGDATVDTGAPSPTVAPTPTPPVATATPTAGDGLVDCTTAPATDSGTVTGLGAGFGTWQRHHDADPEHAGGYLPVMNDGIDRYTSLQCTASGHVARYRMTFIPGVSVAQLRSIARAELPADAHLVDDTSISSDYPCEVLRFTSETVGRTVGAADSSGAVDAEITLTSNPDNVNQMTLALDVRRSIDRARPTSC